MGRHPRRRCATGVGFLTLALSTAIFVAGVAYAVTPNVEDAVGPATRKCWFFNHMNKSGGTSVKKCLSKWMRRKHVRLGLYDSQEWAIGMRPLAQAHLEQNLTMTWGGYTEGLRAYGAQDCKWFTMFRHPISRLVSAHYFCKTYPDDQLCATLPRGADNGDLLAFARHWGNYGLMQFVLAFVKPEDIVPDEETWAVTPKDRVCLQHFRRRNRWQGCPGWYRLKLFVERRSACTGQTGGELECEDSKPPRNQEWMHQFLQPVMDILSEKYAAVGLMEQWDASMQLYQSALGLVGMDWLAASSKVGVTKYGLSQAHQDEAKETLRGAWHDPEIRQLLWLDMLLYDHAVNVFNKQIEYHDVQVVRGWSEQGNNTREEK